MIEKKMQFKSLNEMAISTDRIVLGMNTASRREKNAVLVLTS